MKLRIFARNKEEKMRWAKALASSKRLDEFENELNEFENELNEFENELNEFENELNELKRDVGLRGW